MAQSAPGRPKINTKPTQAWNAPRITAAIARAEGEMQRTAQAADELSTS